MNMLWSHINKKNWKAETKYRTLSACLGACGALAGLIIWLVIQNWVLSGAAWMLCFIGYPYFILWLIGYIYSSNRGFQDGSPYYARKKDEICH